MAETPSDRRISGPVETGVDQAKRVDAGVLAALLTAPVGSDTWSYRPLKLAGTRITGSLDLQGATLTRPLHLEDCVLEEPLRLSDAQAISIYLTDCHLPGIDARGLHSRGDVVVEAGSVVTGEIDLRSARIGGSLGCKDSTFRNKGGEALHVGAGAVVDGSVSLKDSKFIGQVHIGNTHIRGSLNCDGAKFSNPGDTALWANGLRVNSGMFCRDGFTVHGQVELVGAQIAGQLNFDGGKLFNPRRRALRAHGLIVDGFAFCGRGFIARGEVRLVGARINGPLDCNKGTFNNPNGAAINLEGAEITGRVDFHPNRLVGELNLASTRVGSWHDSPDTWPLKGRLNLNGFTYTHINTDKVTVRQRLRWLKRNCGGFMPQPYEQLATVYRRQGNERDARALQVRAQWRRRATAKGRVDRLFRLFRLPWSGLLWITIGYGYRPWNILVPIVSLFVLGSWGFTRAERHGSIVPASDVDPEVRFNGARYAADLLIPGAGLNERNHFIALGHTAWWTTTFTLAGWALAAMLIAGLTGVFRRQ